MQVLSLPGRVALAKLFYLDGEVLNICLFPVPSPVHRSDELMCHCPLESATGASPPAPEQPELEHGTPQLPTHEGCRSGAPKGLDQQGSHWEGHVQEQNS